MKFCLTEHVKVEKVEAGIAVVTLRVPVDLLDSLMALGDHLIHVSRFLKVRSRVLLATDAHSSPAYIALLLAARSELVRSESAKRAARRAAAAKS